MDDLDSRDLLELRANPRSDACVRRLQDRWFKRLRGYALKIGLLSEDTNELCNDWLLRVSNGADAYIQSRSPSPWLWTIFRNLCTDRLREVRRLRRSEASNLEQVEYTTPMQLVGEKEQKQIKMELAHKILDNLPKNERFIYEAYVIHGKDQRSWPVGLAEKLTDITGVAAPSFSEYKRRAEEKVRGLIENYKDTRSAQ